MIPVWLFESIFLGLPLVLLWRVWSRYGKYGASLNVRERTQARIGLGAVSLSTALLIGVFGLMVLGDFSPGAKALLVHMNPIGVGLPNLVLCLLALMCAAVRLGNRAVRNALAASGMTCFFFWLMIALAVH